MNYSNLRDRALSVRALKEQSYRALVNSEAIYSKKLLELRDVKESRAIQESALKILREILDTMAESHINSIVDMITYALQTVFHDRNYEVKLVIGESRSVNTAELVLVDKTTENVVESDIPDSIGGGVSAVIGFTLQVFYVMYFKLNRFMVLDESLSAVSSEYLPNLMQFVKMLSEKRGFIFLAIVHDTRFLNYANKTYRMVNGHLHDITGQGVDEDETN